jgi:midasin
MTNCIQLPIDKFVGFVKHLFDIVHKQKLSITSLINGLFKLGFLNETIDCVQTSTGFNTNFKQDKANLSHLLVSLNDMDNLIAEIDIFFVHVVTMSKFNSQYKTNSAESELKSSFDSIKETLESIKTTSSNTLLSSGHAQISSQSLELKLAFISGNESELNKIQSKLTDGKYFDCLTSLSSSISSCCQPFERSIKKKLAQLDEKLAIVEEMDSNDHNLDEETSKLNLNASTLIDIILKSIEILYKKYSVLVEAKDPADDSVFYQETFKNLSEDISSLNLDKMNQLIQKLLYKQITRLIQSRSESSAQKINEVIQKFKLVKLYADLFKNFCLKWCAYVLDMHYNSCKLLNVLIYVFDEYKSKGLVIPKEFEDEEDEDGESNDNNEGKFETSEDATGLGEGQGVKDVSDQIETEDQLEDAKRKEDYEKEKEEKPDEGKEEIKEEEKGIEMSEDFEGEMNDMEEKEEKKEDEKKEGEEEEEEEPDDQKGSVSDPMEALDKQLWEDEKEGQDDEEDDEPEPEEDNLDENLEGGEKMPDKEDEMLAKEDDLPMVDHEETKNDEGQEDQPQEEDPLDKDLDSMKLEDDDEENVSEGEEETKENDEKADDNEEDEESLEDKAENEENKTLEEHEPDDEGNDPEKNDEQQQNDESNSVNTKQMNKAQNQFGKKNDNNKNQSNTENMDDGENAEENDNDDEQDENAENQDESENMAQSESKSSDNKSKTTDLSTKSNSQQKQNSTARKQQKPDKLRNASENRTLADNDADKRMLKDTKLIDIDEKSENKTAPEAEEDAVEEMDQQEDEEFKHVKDEKEKYDMKAYDAATETQKRKLNEPEKNEKNQEANEEKDQEDLLNENAKKPKDNAHETEKLKEIQNVAKNKKGGHLLKFLNSRKSKNLIFLIF